MNNFARLKESCPFYPLFDRGQVPIINILIPEVGLMEGAGMHEFYRVDVKKLTEDQIDQIAIAVAIECGGRPEEVAAHMVKEGFIPLRALHVASVSSDSLAFL